MSANQTSEVTPADADFHVTIFVEIQTSNMSAGRTNFSFTNRSIQKSPPHHINYTNRQPQMKVLCTAFFQESAFPLHSTIALSLPLCYNEEKP